VLVVAAMLLAARQLGIFQQFADPAGVKQALVQLGVAGYAAFIAVYALLQPFGFPAMVLTFAAPLIWPWPVAFGLSLTGATAASCVGFLFARFIARVWVAARIPARYHRHDDALGRRAFATVLLLRLTFWMSSPLHTFFGVSQVRFMTHLWASLLAYVLPILLISAFGERLVDEALAAPRALWIGLAVAGAILALALVVVRRRVVLAAARRSSPESARVIR
jgi:uncharacterized membrane protein YdjX (TVP38/TMEM64 family)